MHSMPLHDHTSTITVRNHATRDQLIVDIEFIY